MDEIEDAEERRQEFLSRLDAVADGLRASAAGKWVEVRQGDELYAVNAARVVRVWPCARGNVEGLALLDRAAGDPLFITHIGDKPATIESWLRAVEG